MKNDYVTKADLIETAGGLRQEMKSMQNDLHAEIVVFRNELHEEIVVFKNELHDEIVSVKNELHEEIVLFKNELHEEITSVKSELNERITSVETNLRLDIDGLAVQVVEIRSDLNEFKQETRSNFDTVITSIDGVAGILTNIQTDMAATNHALLRHENLLGDHETRLSAIEKRNRQARSSGV